MSASSELKKELQERRAERDALQQANDRGDQLTQAENAKHGKLPKIIDKLKSEIDGERKDSGSSAPGRGASDVTLRSG